MTDSLLPTSEVRSRAQSGSSAPKHRRWPAPDDESIHAVVFDCFGTLVNITQRTDPYQELITFLPVVERASARLAVMTNKWSLAEAAHQLMVPISGQDLFRLQRNLAYELASLACLPGTLDVLNELKERGVRVALCSNLALPYAAPVDALLGHLVDVKVWSFEVAAVKPESRIFREVCTQLCLPPKNVLMVGDSYRSDYTGALAAGMQALHLFRGDASADVNPADLELRICELAEVLRLVG